MIRSILNLSAGIGFLALVSAPSFLLVPLSPVRVPHMMGWLWARATFSFCGVKVEVRGLENIEPGAGYLVMANHTSHFDVLALFGWLPLVVRFVAKRELTRIPLVGWTMALGAAFIVDRSNRAQAIASIERAKRSLLKGQSVLFFPEGTRTPAGEVGALKKGPFYLATGARAPILPVGLSGTGAVMAKGDWHIRPGKIVMRIGAPIDTTGFTQDEAGREACRAAVAGALESLSAISA